MKMPKFTASSKTFFLPWTCLINYVCKYSNEPRSDRRDLLAIKVQSEIFTEKKELAVVNNYRKFDEIIFTNNKDMSVWTRIDYAF